MKWHRRSDDEGAGETRARPHTTTGSPSWPIALASVGICLGGGATIALVAILA
jgi:hypothetical protein